MPVIAGDGHAIRARKMAGKVADAVKNLRGEALAPVFAALDRAARAVGTDAVHCRAEIVRGRWGCGCKAAERLVVRL